MVRLGQPDGVNLLVTTDPAVPAPAVFADPSVAARALSLAVRRSRWLAATDRPLPAPRGVDLTGARRIVAAELSARPDDDWLAPEPSAGLLAAGGFPFAPVQAVGPAGRGGPVALKADVPGMLHKSGAGGVLTGLDSAGQVRRAYRVLRERFRDRLRGVLVQPMAPRGIVLLIGSPAMPLLTVGLGGTATDLIADRAHCLLPAVEAELDAALDRLRAAPRLFAGEAGATVRGQLLDAVRRIAWLAVRLPEVAEAEINPLLAGPAGAVGVDVRVRLAPATPSDPWLRGLPT